MRVKLLRVFYAAFGVLLLVLLAACCAAWTNNAAAALGVAAVLAGALWALLRRFGPAIDRLPPRRFRALYGGLAAAYFVFLLVLGQGLAYVLVSDLGVIYESLPELLANGRFTAYNDYYVACTNNLGLALLLGGFYAVASLFGAAPGAAAGVYAGIAFNCAAVAAALALLGYALWLLVQRQSAALLFLACGAALAPLWLWTPYFYSDTLCLPFLALAFAAWARWRCRGGAGWAALCGAAIFAGGAVKGSVLVLLVAAVLGFVFAAGAAPRRARCRAAAALLLCFALLQGGYTLFQRQFIDWTNRESAAFPTELWLCYGSHDNGDYSQADVDACRALPTVDARRAMLRARIAENYAARSPAGNAVFFLRKAVRTWGDGLYGAEEYAATPLKASWTAAFAVPGQRWHMPLVYYAQSWQYLLLGLAAAGALLCARRAEQRLFLPYVGLFGVMLFLSFWETKARYGLHFAPVLLLCAAGTLALLTEPGKETTAPEEPIASRR